VSDVPSTRHAVFAAVLVVVVVTTAGSAALPAPVGEPHVTAVNDADESYTVTVTAVHTGDPVVELPVTLRFENGTVRRTTLGSFAADPDDPAIFLPHVAGVRVDRPTDRWTATVEPGATAGTTLAAYHPGDAVLVAWTRADGTVTRLKAVGCRSGLDHHETRVTDARGGGGASTGCQSTL
jgi:hypothetical protein